MVDFPQIAAAALRRAEQLLSFWFPAGRLVGREFRIGNLSGDGGNSLSINVDTGLWSDFADSNVGGRDLISLYADSRRIKPLEAAKQIAALCGLAIDDKPDAKPKSGPDDVQVIPVPADAPPLPTSRAVKTGAGWARYDIAHAWAYRNAAGETLGYVVRYETPDGKETPPLTLHRTPRGELVWKYRSFPTPRPLFGQDRLAAAPAAQVIIVEGEKCVTSLQQCIDAAGMQGSVVAACWPGGGKAVRYADWSPLMGRRVVLWPDFDAKRDAITGELLPPEKQPGNAAMTAVAEQLEKIGCTIAMIKQVPGKPDGWDVADAIAEGWGFQDIVDFIKQNRDAKPDAKLDAKPDAKHESRPGESEPLPEPQDNISQEPAISDEPPVGDMPETTSAGTNSKPFRALGYNGEYTYWMPRGTRQVRAIRADGVSAGTMLTLAPLTWWERNYEGRNGPNWKIAADSLLRLSERQGVFDHNRQRGRGAWYDAGRVVLHIGDRLLVDNVETEIDDHASRYIYEASAPIEYARTEPLSNRDAVKLREITDMLYWEKQISSALLAGWCVVAPICGALKYRPHIWITGGAGTGKSYVLEHIVEPCMGDLCIQVASATTSAGIRQKLKNDALAVLFDEFDADDLNAQGRVQSVLELARQAFSESGAKILKGSQGGKAQEYDPKSCFCMSSIGVNLSQHADETRVAVLTLTKPHTRFDITPEEHFSLLQSKVLDTITPEWCAGLRARTVGLVSVIRANAEKFALAVAHRLGTRRAGDQAGALLAGAFSLTSQREISIEAAREWVDKQDWSEQEKQSDETDEQKCLAIILAHTVRMSGGVEISVAELLIACKRKSTEQLSCDDWETELAEDIALRRIGIKYKHSEEIIYFSDSHPGLKRVLIHTPWTKSFARILKRIPGAIEKSCMRFHGNSTRATGLPWNVVMGE